MEDMERLPERLTDQCADAGSLPALAKCAAFIGELMSMAWEGDVDSCDVQDLALRHGVTVETLFHREEHDDGGLGVEEGDTWYVLAPEIAAIVDRGAPLPAPPVEGA